LTLRVPSQPCFGSMARTRSRIILLPCNASEAQSCPPPQLIYDSASGVLRWECAVEAREDEQDDEVNGNDGGDGAEKEKAGVFAMQLIEVHVAGPFLPNQHAQAKDPGQDQPQVQGEEKGEANNAVRKKRKFYHDNDNDDDDDGDDDDDDEEMSELVYQVSEASWSFVAWRGPGVYRVRARQLYRSPRAPNIGHSTRSRSHIWGRFTDPVDVRCDDTGADLFQWSKPEHRLHLRRCLPSFPDALLHHVGTLLGEPLEWDTQSKSKMMAVGFDVHGRNCIARHIGPDAGLRVTNQSVFSSRPLTPPVTMSSLYSSSSSLLSLSSSSSSSFSSSSSPLLPSWSAPSSGVATFHVRIECEEVHLTAIGVCPREPERNADEDAKDRRKNRGWTYGRAGAGVAYLNRGILHYIKESKDNSKDNSKHKSNKKRRGQEEDIMMGAEEPIRLKVDRFGSGDVVGVSLDFGARTLAFFKNGVMQGGLIADVDTSLPLYAAVSMGGPNKQLTLLDH